MLANYNVRQGRVNVLCLLITMLDKEESPCAVLANYNVKQGSHHVLCLLITMLNKEESMCCAC